MKFNEIICFPSIEWSHSWERQQELIYRISKQYPKITIKVVKPLGLVNYNIFALCSKIFSRLFRKTRNRIENDNKKTINMLFYSIFYIPFHFNFIFDKINYFLLCRKIKKSDNAMIWATYMNGFMFEMFKKSKYKVLDFATRRQVNDDISEEAKKIEIKAVKLADLIFVDNYNTYLDYRPYNKNIYYVPQGVNPESFSDEDIATEYIELKKDKKFIIGYCGNMHSVLDYDVLEYIINELNDCTFLFVGSIMDKKAYELQKFTNVIFTGFKEHSELYKYYNLFDVGLIPYTLEPFTTGVYPTKFLEYTVCNVPVVSSRLPDLERYKLGFLKIYDNKFDLINKIKYFQEHCVDKNEIRSFIEDNTWEKRFEIINQKILEL